MIDMRSIAEQRSSETGHPVEEWLKIIESGAETASVGQLTDGEFEDFARGASCPEVYATAVMFFEAHLQMDPDGEPGFDLLCSFVDESTFSLTDWMTSLHEMNRWIQYHKIQTDFSQVLGYIKCCDMSLKNSLDGSLPQTVKDMLESEGFDGRG